jgi:cytochrome b6-f complex subunit 7
LSFDINWKILAMGEIFNTAILAFTLVLVGLGAGFLLLKVTPDD